MKEVFVKYSAYNLWANKRLLEKALQLPIEVLFKEMHSSFGNIYRTFVHIMDVESVWWQRIKLQERVVWPGKDMEEDFEKLSQKILLQSKQWNQWVMEANENYFTHVFGYHNSKKEFFKQPVDEVLLQLFNHQTYHRGQIVTMMKQNGIDKIPETDFIVFSRKK